MERTCKATAAAIRHHLIGYWCNGALNCRSSRNAANRADTGAAAAAVGCTGAAGRSALVDIAVADVAVADVAVATCSSNCVIRAETTSGAQVAS